MQRLFSVDVSRLTGHGTSVTLTLQADNVPTSDEWVELLDRLMNWLMKQPGVTRACYVVEFTARKVPHVHMAVYSDTLDHRALGGRIVRWWLGHTVGTKATGQYVASITGPVGWLEYLSKHSSRGVKHYQRQGMPEGWRKTGRLYGFRGDWPCDEPLPLLLTDDQFYRMRRLMGAYALSQARTRALRLGRPQDWHAVSRVRRSRRVADRNLSTVRGTTAWVPEDVLLRMAVSVGWEGELKPDPAVLENSTNSSSAQASRASTSGGLGG